MTRPVVWGIAGTDSGGGAGLSADQRAADAFGVHLCPVVAAVTAQNSQAVTLVQPVPAPALEAQLTALQDDMPPLAVKTGLLGSAAAVEVVARCIDRLRERGPVALVVDPVRGASTGASFAGAAATEAYRRLLLPRATVLTPNRREAGWLLGMRADDDAQDGGGRSPGHARALQAAGAVSVCITGGDDAGDATGGGWALDWLATPHACGWLALPVIDTRHVHGTGCTFATSVACALALGFVAADALVLAKMATAQALRFGAAAGRGAGPVLARPGFALDPSLLPRLSWGETPVFMPPGAVWAPSPADAGEGVRRWGHRADAGEGGRWRVSSADAEGESGGREVAAAGPLGLYAVVDSAERVRQVLQAGVRTVQLRIKAGATSPALRDAVARSVAAAQAARAMLFINDHWALAQETGAPGVHLGQEDLLALDDGQRAQLATSGLALGVSSHSLWELCRARTLAPRYIACGPVWPTLTKAMPWRPQGQRNLAWWCAMAGVPVVAIGGILHADQVQAAAACGAEGVCIVRGLGDDPSLSVPTFQQALAQGRRQACAAAVPALPQPSLQG
jgi:hydroxymethylpyrimidine kinase/phosphomethylpyrimidine kinase/thiamine-phosphate diphosphorylase